MKITRENYESFFLDYLEGNLKENQIDEFLDFLEQNADLKKELHQFENLNLPEEQILFSEKKKLYKSASEQKIMLENKFVAYLEGDLENEDRLAFEAYLARRPELQKEYNLFTKTRLVPESGIRFSHKQKLYRKSGYTIVMNWVARAAAVIVLIWGINSLYQTRFQPQPQTSNQEFAKLTLKAVTPVEKTETEKKSLEANVQEKLKPIKPAKPKSIPDQPKDKLVEKQQINSVHSSRDLIAIAAISPKMAQLNLELFENHLAVSGSVHVLKNNDHRNVMTIEEFLASKAKKAGNEGLLSVERIARVGLGVASELSGRRIDYKETNGKITSIDFESKLLAFSIPLKKR